MRSGLPAHPTAPTAWDFFPQPGANGTRENFPRPILLCDNFPRTPARAIVTPLNRFLAMPDSPSSHASPPRALIRALRHALRPLVKLMLARGMTFTFASELLKSLFVEVADQDFRLDGKPPTD